MSDVATTKPAAPTRAQIAPLNQVKNLRELFEHPDFQQRIHDSLPKGQNKSRMLRTFIMAVQKVPKLALVNPMQMMGIFTAIAALGLEPNTPLGQCYILPFDKRGKDPETGKWGVTGTDAQLIIGYPGYIDLVYRGDKVRDIDCQVVWEGDEFSYEHGTNKHLRHVAKGKPQKPGAEPIYVYMHARMANGGEQFEVMAAPDVHRIRARSQGFQTAMREFDSAQNNSRQPGKAYTEAPWIKDPIPMWRKTALRAGQKWLPKTVELAAAMALDGDENERVDYGKVIDAEAVTGGAWEPTDEDEAGGGEPEQRQIGRDTPAMTAATLDPRADTVTVTNRGPATVTMQGQRLEPGQSTNVNTAPKQEPAPRAAEAPVLYLVNEDGEMVDGGTHRDPVAYVRAVVSLYGATAPEFKPAILENNAEFTAIAAEHPIANRLLGEFSNELEAFRAAQESATKVVPWFVEIPTRGKDNQQQDLKGYITALELMARDIGKGEEAVAFRVINEPVWNRTPKATRAAAVAVLEATEVRLGLRQAPPKAEPAATAPQEGGDPRPEPPAEGETMLPAASDPGPTSDPAVEEENNTLPDPDVVRLANFREEIQNLRTEFEVRQMEAGAAFRSVTARWQRDRPELYTEAKAMMLQRFTDLGGKVKDQA